MKIEQYKAGARNRQRILDYLAGHPGAMGPQIAIDLGLDKSVVAERLREMVRGGEVEREPRKWRAVGANGKMATQASFAYWALVEKTRSAEEVARHVFANFRAPQPAAARRVEPWITRNADPNRKPIPNQDGQGSSRPRVYVRSSGG